MFPNKLKLGNEVRIIAPSNSLAIISQDCREISNQRFKDMGLKISFGEHTKECNEFTSSSINSRLNDLHSAFADPNVNAILTAIGGYNVNQILPYVDYKLIKNNPKIVCGYSDITALTNAIYAKTGLVTYSGPHYSTFGMQKHCEYNLKYFQKCLMEENSFTIEPSPDWSDDAWYLDQKNRDIKPNEDYWVLNEGSAEGKIIGGNLGTFALLFGTEYMPDLNNTILFVEECYSGELAPVEEFDRLLTSFSQQNNFTKVQGIVIGRFQEKSQMTRLKLEKIIQNNPKLKDLPVIANVDFGHTNPIFTFPIGGICNIKNGIIEIKQVL